MKIRFSYDRNAMIMYLYIINGKGAVKSICDSDAQYVVDFYDNLDFHGIEFLNRDNNKRLINIIESGNISINVDKTAITLAFMPINEVLLNSYQLDSTHKHYKRFQKGLNILHDEEYRVGVIKINKEIMNVTNFDKVTYELEYL